MGNETIKMGDRQGVCYHKAKSILSQKTFLTDLFVSERPIGFYSWTLCPPIIRYKAHPTAKGSIMRQYLTSTRVRNATRLQRVCPTMQSILNWDERLAIKPPRQMNNLHFLRIHEKRATPRTPIMIHLYTLSLDSYVGHTHQSIASHQIP